MRNARKFSIPITKGLGCSHTWLFYAAHVKRKAVQISGGSARIDRRIAPKSDDGVEALFRAAFLPACTRPAKNVCAFRHSGLHGGSSRLPNFSLGRFDNGRCGGGCELLAGRGSVIRTSVPAEHLDAAETVQTYKDLSRVERASLRLFFLSVGVLRRTLDEAERMLITLCVDPDRRDQDQILVHINMSAVGRDYFNLY